MRSSVVALTLALAACGGSEPPERASSPPRPPRPAPTASSSAASAPTPPAPAASSAEELALGEAVLLDGSPVPRADNPTTKAITYQGNAGVTVVMAHEVGDATLEYTTPDGRAATRAFRVARDLCRDRPLHRAIVLGLDERATLPANDVTRVDVTRRHPWIAAAGISHGSIVVVGQSAGHSTVIAVTSKGSTELWDVFVGGACAHKRYASVAAATPPGQVGPKGDGTCVRTVAGAKPVAAPCPDRAALESLSNDALTPIACDWSASCGRMGDEGCCVGCTDPMAMRIARTCAIKALRADTCADALRALSGPGCGR